jgi:hypothetical protein
MSKLETGSKIHPGIRNYTGQEATNLVLGQGGFDIIQGAATNGTIAIAGQGDYADVRMWIAIKASEGALANVCCETVIGDDFSKNKIYQATAGEEMTLQDQDMVNGAFTTIRVVGTTAYVLAYRG